MNYNSGVPNEEMLCIYAFILFAALHYGEARTLDCGQKVGGTGRNTCPRMVEDDPIWRCLSSVLNCSNGLVYHCLRNYQGEWTEVCAREQMCDEGKEPMVTQAGNIVCRYCHDPERYNPEKETLSNMLSECQNKKTVCKKEKNDRIECEEPYDKEDPYSKHKMDRLCRCSYEENMVPKFYVFERDSWTCSYPEVMKCLHMPCPMTEDGVTQTRGRDYKCHPVKYVSSVTPSFTYVSNKSKTFPRPETYPRTAESTAVTAVTTNSTVSTFTPSPSEEPTPQTMTVGIVVGIISGIVLTGALVIYGIATSSTAYTRTRGPPKSPPLVIKEHYKRVINRNIENLKNDMAADVTLDHIKMKEIGIHAQHTKIKESADSLEKNDRILQLIMTNGFEAYTTFKTILYDTNKFHLLDALERTETEIEKEEIAKQQQNGTEEEQEMSDLGDQNQQQEAREGEEAAGGIVHRTTNIAETVIQIENIGGNNISDSESQETTPQKPRRKWYYKGAKSDLDDAHAPLASGEETDESNETEIKPQPGNKTYSSLKADIHAPPKGNAHVMSAENMTEQNTKTSPDLEDSGEISKEGNEDDQEHKKNKTKQKKWAAIRQVTTPPKDHRQADVRTRNIKEPQQEYLLGIVCTGCGKEVCTFHI